MAVLALYTQARRLVRLGVPMIPAVLVCTLVTACGSDRTGDRPEHASSTRQADSARALTAHGDSAKADSAARTPKSPFPYDTVGARAASASSITPQMVSAGAAIFHGKGAQGSSCSVCHGATGHGTANGPDLTSGNWIDISGQYQTIIDVVTYGITTPKRFSGAMPPKGGAQLDAEAIRNVAAYVYMLSPPNRRRAG